MMSLISRVASLFAGGSAPRPNVQHLTILGIPVEVDNTRPDIDTSAVVERLGEALDLIAAYQPWRLAHVRRDVRMIRVERFACRGAYFPAERVIMTELTFLARRDITAATVASSIIHEGIHARVNAFGAHRDGQDMPREERLCRRAELAFGRALPESLGAPVVQRALESLAMDDWAVAPAVDWQEAQRRQEAADREARA